MRTVHQFPSIVILKDGEIDYDSIQRLTSFSSSLGVYESPGTASLAFKLMSDGDKTKREKVEFINNSDECTLWQSMDEIEVWMAAEVRSGRLAYFPVFWGLVTSAAPFYSEGQYNLNVNCSGILEFLKSSRLNIGLDAAAAADDIINSLGAIIYTNKYTGKSVAELFKHIIQSATTSEELLITNYNFESIFGVGGENNAGVVAGVNTQAAIAEERQNVIAKDGSKRQQAAQDGKLGLINKETRKAIDANRIRYTEYWTSKAFTDRLSKRLLFVDDANVLSKLHPIEIAFKGNSDLLDLIKGEFITRLQMAQDIANDIGWEFFMDVTGEIVLKPPMFNIPATNAIYPEEIASYNNTQLDLSAMMTVVEVLGRADRIKQVSEGAQFRTFNTYMAINPDTVTVKSEAEKQKALTDNKANVLEQIGRSLKEVEENFNVLNTASEDRYSVLQYGVRSPGVVNNPLLRTNEECELYARWYVDKHNADVERKTIVLKALRPDIRLGLPILNYQDMSCWYVKKVTHAYQPESKIATTTVELQARRKPLWKNKENKLAVSVVPPVGSKFFGWEDYGTLAAAGMGFQYGAALEDNNIAEIKRENEDTQSVSPTPTASPNTTGGSS